jgi:hypothetical protein
MAPLDFYTFHGCYLDGSSTALERRQQASDTEAGDYAGRVLAEHDCAYVSVWCGDRPVMTRYRRPVGVHAFHAANDGSIDR